jgi:D-glycerate 3-kinase
MTVDLDWLAAFLRAESSRRLRRRDRALPRALAARIAAVAMGPAFVVGICGPQGSGKTTTVRVVAALLEARGLKVATLSLDDLYLPRADREALARDVHPLLRTRGVPGTTTSPWAGRAGRSGGRGRDRAAALRQGRGRPRARRRLARGRRGPSTSCCSRAGASGPVRSRPKPWPRRSTPWSASATRTASGAPMSTPPWPDPIAPCSPAWTCWCCSPRRTSRRCSPGDGAGGQAARSTGGGQGEGLAMSDDEVAVFVQHYERLTRHIAAKCPPAPTSSWRWTKTAVHRSPDLPFGRAARRRTRCGVVQIPLPPVLVSLCRPNDSPSRRRSGASGA